MDVALVAGGILFAMQGAVVGTVRDGGTGTPLAGAVVALPDAERTTTTSAEGRYALHDVPAGPHHLTVRMIGYAPRSLHALVAPDGPIEINVSLHALPTRLRTVTVRAPVVVRGLDIEDSTTFPDRGMSIAAVRNHPLLSEPDALEALGGGEVVVRPESPSGVHVRGGASDQTAYVLDGIPVLNPYHAAGVFGAWNPDALSRVRLSSADPLLTHPHALSGTIAGATRAPGDRLRGQGGVSTTHARVTVDGRLGTSGPAYLVSLRSAFPGIVAPRDEASYLHGELGDWLAKVETALWGGRARVLAYANENELSAASATEEEGTPLPEKPRNLFTWGGHSTGAEWSRAFPSTTLRLSAWSALGDAEARWGGGSGVELTSRRRDHGMLATVERAATAAGIRVERIETSYRVAPATTTEPPWVIDGRTPVVSVFAQHVVSWGDRVEAEIGASLAAMRGVYPGPRLRLRWRAAQNLTITGSYARTHQFAQSLRNAESMVGNVFPADLFVSAGAPAVPVAWSDYVIAAAEYRPTAGVRLGAQSYTRSFNGLVVVAPRAAGPFSTSAFAVGSGSSRGASAEATVRGARYGLTVGYGWQRVRLQHGDSSYTPDFATAHLFEGGTVLFPTPTLSVRLGATAGVGRRTSIVIGDVEWESCNLIDQGCELGGSPHNEAGPPGATPLPAYLRVDLGVRKHWHIDLAGRDVMLAAFGTVTNLFGRRNLLTYARNPSTGEVAEIGLRPLAPLVVGLDWRF